MLGRKEVLNRVIHDCMKEMYDRSQPSADWDKLIEDYKNGVIGKDERVYERHYLSKDEYDYVLKKHLEANGIKNRWPEYVSVVEEYLSKGGLKDAYVKDWTDDRGFHYPGYRTTEEVPPIKNQIESILSKYVNDKFQNETIANEIADAVMDDISECKNFYRFDREEGDVRCAIALGASPTSNPKTVIEYWKSKGVDLQIEERNPLFFWEKDYYEDEFEEVMIDEYGENWKEELDKKWKDQVEKEEKERQERLERIKASFEKLNKEDDKAE